MPKDCNDHLSSLRGGVVEDELFSVPQSGTYLLMLSEDDYGDFPDDERAA
jgi:hypothetical protein